MPARLYFKKYAYILKIPFLLCMSDAATTKICGYFNGNKWPIQLVISRFNLTLYLQPGDYILAKNGQAEQPADTTAYAFNEGLWHRKINDPFFEAYASTKQLKRELVDKPVSIVVVPLPDARELVPATACDGQSVRVVTEWRKDKKGNRQPVMPQPRVLPPQSVNKSSVIPMSVDEARKRGLIGRPRIVSEDYGITDTDGTPPSSPPKIRYSMESTVNRSVSPLPEELTQVTDKDVPPEQVALKRTLQAQLKTASAQFPTAESPTGFLNAATPMAPLSSTVRTGKPNLPVRHAPPPFPLSPRPVVKPVAEVELPQPETEGHREEDPHMARRAAVREPGVNETRDRGKDGARKEQTGKPEGSDGD